MRIYVNTYIHSLYLFGIWKINVIVFENNFEFLLRRDYIKDILLRIINVVFLTILVKDFNNVISTKNICTGNLTYVFACNNSLLHLSYIVNKSLK